MNGSRSADVIVVGLGAVGSATLFQLARRGIDVIGIDRYAPPHERGSSHGSTRITRLAIGEGEVFVPLVQRSNVIWRELEAEHGASLLLRTGGIVMGSKDGSTMHHGKRDFVQRSIDAASRHGIEHEVLDADEIAARHPQFVLRGDERAYYEPGAGVLRPEACVAVQIAAARAHGARVQLDERVLEIVPGRNAVTVRTDRWSYSAARVVVAAGPWLPAMLPGSFGRRVRVLRQSLHWFRTALPALYTSPHCPIFIWMHGSSDEDYLYGFPMVDAYSGVKVATEQYRQQCDPDEVDRQVSDAESRAMFDRHVDGRLRGVTPECIHAAACLYTVTEDAGFIVHEPPSLPGVTAVSACSGHGFKHSAALGEALAQQIMESGEGLDLSPFSMARFEGDRKSPV